MKTKASPKATVPPYADSYFKATGVDPVKTNHLCVVMSKDEAAKRAFLKLVERELFLAPVPRVAYLTNAVWSEASVIASLYPIVLLDNYADAPASLAGCHPKTTIIVAATSGTILPSSGMSQHLADIVLSVKKYERTLEEDHFTLVVEKNRLGRIGTVHVDVWT